MLASTRGVFTLPLTLLAVVSLAACAPADDADTPDLDEAAAETDAAEEPMADAEGMGEVDGMDEGMALESALSGTAWQLVAIRSMDDSEYVPEGPSQYTLTLTEDGTAQILSHCNRGRGTYTSAAPGQIQFGPIALTRMACPEPSIAQRYETQFEYVRSYVIENGHLFLATMADGAIIEFAPMEAEAE